MFNSIKTVLLLGLLTGFLLVIGRQLGGQTGMVVALVLSVGMNFFSWWFSDKIVLSMYNAHEVTEAATYPKIQEIRQVLGGLARRAGVPVPRLYVIDDPSPNAFATGRDPAHAAVAVTTGIMDLMTPEELSGVLGHELTHVINRDTLTSTVAASIAGAVTMLASMAQWAAIFGGAGERRARRRRGGRFTDDHSGSDRRHAGPDGHFQIPGIRGGRGRSEAVRQSALFSQGSGKTRTGNRRRPHGRQSLHRSYVHS